MEMGAESKQHCPPGRWHSSAFVLCDRVYKVTGQQINSSQNHKLPWPEGVLTEDTNNILQTPTRKVVQLRS